MVELTSENLKIYQQKERISVKKINETTNNFAEER